MVIDWSSSSSTLPPASVEIPNCWYTGQCPVLPRYASNPPIAANTTPPTDLRDSPYATNAPPPIKETQRSVSSTFASSCVEFASHCSNRLFTELALGSDHPSKR